MTNLSGANLNNGAAVGPQGEGRESPSSFPKYPAYKDSGVKWLGDVPEGWSVASLRFFADLITGITPPSDDLSNYAEEGWSWVRPEDLDDSGKPVLASKFLTDQGWAFCRKVKGQSTLICCIGTIGKLGFIETDACTNQQITAVVPRQGGRFYFYAMHALKPAFDAYATGNVLRILNSERLGSVEVAVPSKSEADSIARFLDHETARIDALIEEQQRLIELLKEKRQAVISHAVTKGLGPTVPMKDSGVEWLGEVPAHWDVKRLKHLCSDIKAGPFGSALTKDMYVATGYKIYGQEQVIPGNFDIGDYYIDEERYASLRQYQVRSGDVLISCVGTFGKIAVVPEAVEPGIINPRLIRVRVNSFVSSQYLSTVLRSGVVFEQFSLLSRGGTMDVINIGTLSEIDLALPPLEEQLKVLLFITDQTRRFDNLVDQAFQGVELLQERRSALISAAVTGKIDVRGWQPPATAPSTELVQEAL